MSLPAPNAAEQAHSDRLAEHIRQVIAAAGGTISFSRFMELALYAPGLGYYSAGKTKFGAAGDFVTAPELGSLFAQCLARAIAPQLAAIESATVIELGPGSGVLAADLLLELERLGHSPARYLLLERSGELRERQRRTLSERCAHLLARIDWLDAPPEHAWQGVLLGNEVIDALPVERFVLTENGFAIETVAVTHDGSFRRRESPAPPRVASLVAARLAGTIDDLPRAYRSEILPELDAWFAAVAGNLERGVVLFGDYGYARREYYAPERRDGTLICHYQHRAHNDPMILLGLQDITASVDFTALAEAGCAAGFELAGYTSQAQFLIGSGLADVLGVAQNLPISQWLALTQQAKRLTLPGEMGERFQWIGFTRGNLLPPIEAFAAADFRRRL
jgi:SAM-dependent MidA family methyltransferase